MSYDSFYKKHSKSLGKRYSYTLDYVTKYVGKDEKILDLGVPNSLSQCMENAGFSVANTPNGIDLDNSPECTKVSHDVLTAFEILEHLVSPLPLLQNSCANKLLASVPLKLWFADAYWSSSDPYDRHYHEFEPRQFDMLLEKAGWEIKDSMKWKAYDNSFGFRPILRRFTDRYYLVYCERSPK